MAPDQLRRTRRQPAGGPCPPAAGRGPRDSAGLPVPTSVRAWRRGEAAFTVTGVAEPGLTSR
jgi:hypothetical protein